MTPLTWGRWKLNERGITLDFYDDERGNIYPLDLERFTTSAGILDAVFQVHKKTFVDDQDRADLLYAIEDIFDPQGNYCSCGNNMIADPVELVRSTRDSLAWKNKFSRLVQDLTIPSPDEPTR